MAKKQTIILTHGSNAPVYSKDYKKGEVLVRHASKAKDAALYTANENETDWLEFPSKEWVDDKFTATGGINEQITALDNRVKANTDAIDAIEADYLKAADKTELSNTISGVSGRVKTIEDDYLTSADKTELEGEIQANTDAIGEIKADYLKAADKTELSNAISGVSGRVKTIEDDYLKAADKTELSNAINTLKNTEVKANTDAIGEIKADYLKADDKTELLNKITAAQNAATTKVESGDDFIDVTQSTDETTQSTTYKVAITNKVATAESLKTATDRLEAVEGEDKGKSMRTVAKAEVDAFKNLLYGEGTADVIDTLQDVINWIGTDESGATKIVADIAELQKVTSGYEGEKAIQTAVKANTDAIDAIEADYLTSADKTELEGKVTAEANARETADKNINDKIGGEFSATNTVAQAIAAEQSAREEAIKGVQDLIVGLDSKYATDDELSSAVTTLEGKITAAKNAATTKVVEGTDAGNNLSISNTTAEDGSVTYTVNLSNVAKADELTAVSNLVNPVKDAVVTASVENTETNNITASVASHHLTLNFDSMVIDGGTY
jgi:hypothetical protein